MANLIEPSFEGTVSFEKMEAARDRRLKGFIFSIFTIQALVSSFFPLYFDFKGFSKLQIGFLTAIGPFVGIFSNLFWGILCDKYQTIKKLLLVILAGQLLLATVLFQMHSFASLFVVLLFFFFFQGPMYSLTDSLTLLSIQGGRKSYSSFRVWGSIGFSSAVFLFGMLLKHWGSGLTVWLCMGAILVTMALALLIRDREGSMNKLPSVSLMIKTVMSGRLLWFIVVALFISVSSRMNDNFIGLYLRGMGASDQVVGWAWLIGAVSETPMMIYLGKYGKKYKETSLLAIASLVYALRFFLMSRAESPDTVLLIQLMHCFSFGIYFVTAIRYVGRLVPGEYRTTGLAVFAVIWYGASGVIGGIMGGWTFEHWGPHGLYLTAMTVALAAFVGFIGTYWADR